MSYYNSIDGLNYIFEERWNTVHSHTNSIVFNEKQFPNSSVDLLKRYNAFEEYMNENWHQYINLGAAVTGGQLLTDHGTEHVKSVICHAADILSDNINKLNGYELYLLLIAIHFHDIGNILGRENHEKKIVDIIEKMGDKLQLDTLEKELVTAIAMAHGGYLEDENKDTIRIVQPDTHYDGIFIRPQALAAILRFADEISDDLRRSISPRMEIPDGCQVYHEFSRALTPISIVGETITFHFKIPYLLALKKLGKGESDILLYDEILERMAKCMRELEYCKKYANGLIKVSRIDVTIDILKEDSDYQIIKEMSSSFRLTLHGYPNINSSKLVDYLEPKDANFSSVGSLKYSDGKSLITAIKQRKNGGKNSD